MKYFCVYWMEALKSVCWMSSYVGPLQKCWSPCLEHLFIFSWGERSDLRTHNKARQQILESTATGTPESLSAKHPRKWWTAIEYHVEWSGERGQKCFWVMRLTWSSGFRERENWNWALKCRIKSAERMEKMRQEELGAETFKYAVLGNWGRGAEAARVAALWLRPHLWRRLSTHLHSSGDLTLIPLLANLTWAQLMISNRSCRDQGNCRELRSRNSSEFTVGFTTDSW